MKLQDRIELLYQLNVYLGENGSDLEEIKHRANRQNGWFVPDFIHLAIENIRKNFLVPDKPEAWANQYNIPERQVNPKTVGVTMAGNIPLVGFHDFLTIFLSGHKQRIKPSSKDELLIKHIVEILIGLDERVNDYISFSERLNGCEAYIATGSNNSARYFEYYFGKYPHIIRRNRTSAAVLTGNESPEELNLLADDMLLYFGLGCRNVSRLFVPRNYDFVPLLRTLDKFNWMKDHNKYRNNYDYQLSLYILNNRYYMSNDAVLMVEDDGLFSPISQVNYSFYDEGNLPGTHTFPTEDLQCLCGGDGFAFGQAQSPSLTDYADGVDTMAFALQL